MTSIPILRAILRTASVLALLSIAVWLGGIIALGALVAPVVFSMVALPFSADAMVVVFRHFDLVAMTCAAIVLGTEGLRKATRLSAGRWDVARAAVSVTAAAAAVFQAMRVSPRIADLHAVGVIRGVGDAGLELSRLHDVAEACGKAQLVLLVVLVVLHVVTLSSETAIRRVATAPHGG